MTGEIVSEFLIKDISEIYPGTTMDSWYFDDLVTMQSVGAVPRTDNLIADITRAEFVHILYEYCTPSGGTGILTFTDVSNDYHFAPAIKWAMKAGIIRGITDKTFAPDKKIARLEMIVMLARFDEERGNLLTATEPQHHLEDCDKIPEWGRNAAHWAIANEIIYGHKGNVLPDDYVKVKEAIAMISRLGNYS